MIGRAGARGGVVERAGLRLGERDELLEVLRRHLRIDHHHELGIVERRHRHEVAHQRIRLVRKQRLVRGERVGDGEQRVAVRRRFRDHVGADHRGRAGPVLDDHRLLELLGQGLRDLAAEYVARAAGAERRNDLDRAGRIVLCAAGAARGDGAARATRARDSFDNRDIRGHSGVIFRHGEQHPSVDAVRRNRAHCRCILFGQRLQGAASPKDGRQPVLERVRVPQGRGYYLTNCRLYCAKAEMAPCCDICNNILRRQKLQRFRALSRVGTRFEFVGPGAMSVPTWPVQGHPCQGDKRERTR